MYRFCSSDQRKELVNRELALSTIVLLCIQVKNTPLRGLDLERLGYLYKVKYLRKVLDIFLLEIALYPFYLSIKINYYLIKTINLCWIYSTTYSTISTVYAVFLGFFVCLLVCLLACLFFPERETA